MTSLGPQGTTPGARIQIAPGPNRVHHDGRRRSHDDHFVGPVWYAVPVPYAVDSANPEAEDADAADDVDHQGGPTVFDRRGSGERSYIPPVKDAPPAHALSAANDPPADPEPTLPLTLLVFKDGHKLEISNYAIIGTTLFDLTPGHPRKVALADLDLDATRKENDDRGVVFQTPQTPAGS